MGAPVPSKSSVCHNAHSLAAASQSASLSAQHPPPCLPYPHTEKDTKDIQPALSLAHNAWHQCFEGTVNHSSSPSFPPQSPEAILQPPVLRKKRKDGMNPSSVLCAVDSMSSSPC